MIAILFPRLLIFHYGVFWHIYPDGLIMLDFIDPIVMFKAITEFPSTRFTERVITYSRRNF